MTVWCLFPELAGILEDSILPSTCAVFPVPLAATQPHSPLLKSWKGVLFIKHSLFSPNVRLLIVTKEFYFIIISPQHLFPKHIRLLCMSHCELFMQDVDKEAGKVLSYRSFMKTLFVCIAAQWNGAPPLLTVLKLCFPFFPRVFLVSRSLPDSTVPINSYLFITFCTVHRLLVASYKLGVNNFLFQYFNSHF